MNDVRKKKCFFLICHVPVICNMFIAHVHIAKTMKKLFISQRWYRLYSYFFHSEINCLTTNLMSNHIQVYTPRLYMTNNRTVKIVDWVYCSPSPCFSMVRRECLPYSCCWCTHPAETCSSCERSQHNLKNSRTGTQSQCCIRYRVHSIQRQQWWLLVWIWMGTTTQ